MDISIIVSIFSIFFLTSIGTMIKNVFFNENALHRNIRFYLLLITFGYLVFVIMTLIFLWKEESNLTKELFISLFLFLSINILFTLIEAGSKKASVRDAWKYRSENHKDFDGKRTKSLFEGTEKVIICIFRFTPLILSIIICIFCKGNWIYYFLIFWTNTHIILNHIIFSKKRRKLINMNVKYNELKKIILTENINNINKKTLEAIGLELIELYKNLFIESIYYSNAKSTNNAILKAIAYKTSLEKKDYEEFIK